MHLKHQAICMVISWLTKKIKNENQAFHTLEKKKEGGRGEGVGLAQIKGRARGRERALAPLAPRDGNGAERG